MSAEISFIDGKAEAAFALKPAWWDVADEYTLDHIRNSEEMIQAAHLDWDVELQQIYDNDGRHIPGYATTIRKDTGFHLGVMSDSFRVVQNREEFSFLDKLLQDGIMKYESAGALRGGRTVWVLGRMPTTDKIAEGDELQRYVLWLNSHDASGALYAIPTSVRVVCANTAAMAVKGQKGVRHWLRAFRHGWMDQRLASGCRRHERHFLWSRFENCCPVWNAQGKPLPQVRGKSAGTSLAWTLWGWTDGEQSNNGL